MGHDITLAEGWARGVAGRGQIIQAVNDPSGRRVWACGSDMRADGHAVPQI
jgi:gamma-glutamyltranspeptidase/glutathione hydrolase